MKPVLCSEPSKHPSTPILQHHAQQNPTRNMVKVDIINMKYNSCTCMTTPVSIPASTSVVFLLVLSVRV